MLSGGLALFYLGMGCTQGQSNAGLASRAAHYKQRIIRMQPAGRRDLVLSLAPSLSDFCSNTKLRSCYCQEWRLKKQTTACLDRLFTQKHKLHIWLSLRCVCVLPCGINIAHTDWLCMGVICLFENVDSCENVSDVPSGPNRLTVQMPLF